MFNVRNLTFAGLKSISVDSHILAHVKYAIGSSQSPLKLSKMTIL